MLKVMMYYQITIFGFFYVQLESQKEFYWLTIREVASFQRKLNESNQISQVGSHRSSLRGHLMSVVCVVYGQTFYKAFNMISTFLPCESNQRKS